MIRGEEEERKGEDRGELGTEERQGGERRRGRGVDEESEGRGGGKGRI